jgi:hypothetical protein
MKSHPDSPEGAIAFLRAETGFLDGVEDESLVVDADPWLRGVWKIQRIDPSDRSGSFEVVVYLAGYPDPWGNLRTANDCEGLFADEWLDEVWTDLVEEAA